VVNAHAEDGWEFYRSTLSAFPSSLVVSMRYWGRKMEPDRGGRVPVTRHPADQAKLPRKHNVDK
ncbi:hypothetical protein, partial [Pseudomonas sp. Y24-6]|uniref:hypothetical protein n=1 Tax=Pseudomonas sp. Y24-6 TaxID=2750013 RepID=UPI001CE0DCB0